MVAPRLRLPAAGRPGGTGREVLQAELDAARELLLPSEQLPSRPRSSCPPPHQPSPATPKPSVSESPTRCAGCCSTPTGCTARTSPTQKCCAGCWPHPSAAATPPRGRCVTLRICSHLGRRHGHHPGVLPHPGLAGQLAATGNRHPSRPEQSRIDAHRCPDPVQARRRHPRAEHRPARHRRRRSQPASGRRSTRRYLAPLSFSAADQVRVMAGSRTPQGYIRPAITQPGKPDGEVAT